MMHWLQDEDGRPSLQALQLDIVGFLAILGEGSVQANAQVSTLSRWIFLPRLIPAPQAMMRPTRPTKLTTVPGSVTGISSGNHRNHINHIANIVCDASALPAHSVRVVSIERTGDTDLKSKTVAPLTVALFLGFFLSCLLLGLSIWLDDGMSVLATVLLSTLTSLIGLGNKWTLHLPKRKHTNRVVPRGDVVIRYPKGSFLIVKCEENVARELYFAPEEIEYLLEQGPAYRLLSLVGTMMLMGGVIALANAQIESQIAWAASYMLLGASYWIVAALPEKLHWDYSCYTVTNHCLSDSKEQKGFPSLGSDFTEALWKAIVVTGSIAWIRTSNACPDNPAWRRWLENAEAAATDAVKDCSEAPKQMHPGVTTWRIPDWKASQSLSELLKKQVSEEV